MVFDLGAVTHEEHLPEDIIGNFVSQEHEEEFDQKVFEAALAEQLLEDEVLASIEGENLESVEPEKIETTGILF